MVVITALVAAIYASVSQKQKETKMEPEKFDKKKFDDLFKNLNFSFSTFPIHSFKFPHHKQETAAEMLTRLDNDDAIIDAMTSYPTAERMLWDLFNGEK